MFLILNDVPGRDQKMYGSFVSFLVEIKCCKAVLQCAF